MRSFLTRNPQKGIGLLELMLALAIIAILIVMATRYFSKASDNQKINLALQEMTEIKNAAIQVHQAGGAISWTTVAPNLTGTLSATNQNGPFVGSTYGVTDAGVTLSGLPNDGVICKKLNDKLAGDCADPKKFIVPIQ
jgi:prepilin-type N-terminal cleavage/methylation domain-containing protein